MLIELVKSCRHAVHHTQNTSFNYMSQRFRLTPGRRCILCDATRQTTTHIADCHTAAWVVVCGSWHGSDFKMSLHAAYYFLQNQYRRSADGDSRMF